MKGRAEIGFVERDAIVVRRARLSDREVLGMFGTLLVSMHHDLDPQRFIDITPTTSKRYGRFLETKLDAPEHIVLVAEVATTVIGYVYAALEGYDYMSLRGPAGVIHDLYVDENHRKCGVGRRLAQSVLHELASLECASVVLSTASRNAAAQRLFGSIGFRPTMIEMTREMAPAGTAERSAI